MGHLNDLANAEIAELKAKVEALEAGWRDTLEIFHMDGTPDGIHDWCMFCDAPWGHGHNGGCDVGESENRFTALAERGKQEGE